jgi:serine protease Do
MNRNFMTEETLNPIDRASRRSKSSPVQKILAYSSLLILGAGLGIGGAYAYKRDALPLMRSVAVAPAISGQPDKTDVAPASITTPTNFVSAVVQEVGPAVVRINASRTVTNPASEFSNDPFFGRFFSSPTPEGGEKQVQRGTGSGFILSADGQILTNAHVVDGADKVTVTLKDGRTLDGRVLGTDSLTDVAVVQIEAENLPTVKLGNSDSLQVGEWAIAIGNPLGLDNTVTTGIISAKGRSSAQIGATDKRVGFIQTDAAINPGNSGGPLLNAQGEVIGINSAIIQNAQGLGFAVPINTAQKIAEQLIAKGKVDHPYLGVQMVQLTPEVKDRLQESPIAESWNVTDNTGVLVVKVLRDSPAARAGLKSGDVLTSVQGEKVTDPDTVQRLVENARIGEGLPVKVSRGGQALDFTIQVGHLDTASKS